MYVYNNSSFKLIISKNFPITLLDVDFTILSIHDGRPNDLCNLLDNTFLDKYDTNQFLLILSFLRKISMVHDSNMSKTCKTEEEAVETVQWYYDNREDFDKKNPSQAPIDPRYRQNGNVYVVYNGKTGKVLKSKSYKKVDFTNMV